jgi:hypothetical protein
MNMQHDFVASWKSVLCTSRSCSSVRTKCSEVWSAGVKEFVHTRSNAAQASTIMACGFVWQATWHVESPNSTVTVMCPRHTLSQPCRGQGCTRQEHVKPCVARATKEYYGSDSMNITHGFVRISASQSVCTRSAFSQSVQGVMRPMRSLRQLVFSVVSGMS